MRRKKIKIGAGVICYRWNKLICEYEYLLVCKQFTDVFVNIITGRYIIGKKPLNLYRLSPYEKYLINTYSIRELHCKYFKVDWSNADVGLKDFILSIDEKFEKYGKAIGDHISSSLWYMWEIPKGHKSSDESIMQCAQRELLEETNMKIEIGNSIYVVENIYTHNYIYRITYFAHRFDNAGDTIAMVDNPNSNEILCYGWFTLGEAENIINQKKYQCIVDINALLGI